MEFLYIQFLLYQRRFEYVLGSKQHREGCYCYCYLTLPSYFVWSFVVNFVTVVFLTFAYVSSINQFAYKPDLCNSRCMCICKHTCNHAF